MANNLIQIKRTSVTGRAANTTTLPNPGELALNMTDGIMYSGNGSVVFEIGANNTNVNVSGNLTVKSIIANGAIGSTGTVLTSNGSSVYWAPGAPATTDRLVNGSYQLNVDSYGVVNVPISQFSSGQVFAPINYSLYLGTSSKFIQINGSDASIQPNSDGVANLGQPGASWNNAYFKGSVNAASFTGLSYANPNLLLPKGDDPYWAYGSDVSGSNVYMQVKFWGGGGDASRYFTIVDSSNNNELFRVDGTAAAFIKKLSANGSLGSAGQALFSNGSDVYWGSGATGYTGSQGTTGFTGSKGDQGTEGFTGSQGGTGYVGSQGTTGFTGSQGDQGTTGYTGSQGTTGYVGSKGETGFVGSQGDTGYTGSQGNTGYVGSQGDAGYTGSQGPQGNFGGAAFEYIFDSAIIDTALSPGNARINDGPWNSPTANTLYLAFSDVYGDNCYSFITTIDDSTSNIKGHFSLADKANTAARTLFAITGSVSIHDNHFHIPISYLSGDTGAQSNPSNVIFTFARTGDIGDTGYTGSQGLFGYTGSQGTTGYAGSQGTTGFTGSVGFAGSQGNVGYVGSTGFTGSQGNVGYTGSKGDQGTEGFTGSQGGTGYVGSQGSQGTTGFTGSKGDQGTTGFTGSVGYSGSQGNLGYTGSVGYTGSKGDQGTTGFTGSQGSTGTTGFTGSQGTTGYTGSKGDQGTTGFTGSEGPQGPMGLLGYTGSRGADGTSGYNGSVGFTGSRGADGTSGYNGSVGFTGSRGADGTSGYNGSVGFTGSKGDQGTSGFTGSAGPVAGSNTQVVFNDSGSANGSSGLTYNKVTQTLTIGKDVYIGGNVYITGNVSTFAANNLSITDNMIYLNSNSLYSNPDIGFAANYNDGNYRHTGFFRDHNNGVWKVFEGYAPEPDASQYIDQSNNTFKLADFQANSVYMVGLYANGTLGTTGQVLASNGTGLYWTADQTSSNITAVYLNSNTLNSDYINIGVGFITVGNSTVNTTMSNNGIRISNTTSNSVFNIAILSIGNTTVNTSINSTAIYLNANNGAFKVPVGTTAQRPASPPTGLIRFNTDTTDLEYSANSTQWYSITTQETLTSNNINVTTAISIGNNTVNTYINSTALFLNSNNGAFKIPVGTTAQRPANATTGLIRFNTTTTDLEYAANSSTWYSITTQETLTSNNINVTTAISIGNNTVNTFINSTSLSLNSNNGFLKVPVGTTAQRPSNAQTGYLRFNTTTSDLEYAANSTQWYSVTTQETLTSNNISVNNNIVVGNNSVNTTISSTGITTPAIYLTSNLISFDSYSTTLSASPAKVVSFPVYALNSSSGAGYTVEFFVKFNTLSSTSSQTVFTNSAVNQLGMQANTSTVTIFNAGYTSYSFTLNTPLTTGVWYHFAYMGYNGATYIAINGSTVYSSNPGGYSAYTPTGTWSTGWLSLTGPATFSNFRLTTNRSVYNLTGFIPPSQPLTSITGTKVLTLQDSTFKDNSGLNGSITTSGSPTLGLDSIYLTGTSTSIVASIVGGIGSIDTLTLKNLYANGSYGTAGQVLASNGIGLYWTNDQVGNSITGSVITANTLNSDYINIGVGYLSVGNSTVNTVISNSGIRTANTTANVVLSLTDFRVPVGNTFQRPANATTGFIRFNTDSTDLEYAANSTTWYSITTQETLTSNNISVNNTITVGNSTVNSVISSLFVKSTTINTTAIYANGSFGTAGQVLTSNGTKVYWSTAIGYAGSQGSTGFAGSVGFTGSIGYTGSRGTDGIVGYNGSVGFTGSQGVGFTGSRGDVGYTGSRGTDGVIGYNGSTGFTGSQGANSLYTVSNTAPISPTAGDRWFHTDYGIELVYTYDGDSSQWVEISASGFAGQIGPTGYTGSLGYSGSRGVDGVVGYNGSVGFTGSTGASAISLTFDTKTNSYTLQANDDNKLISITVGGITVPANTFNPGQTVTVYNANTSNSQTITQGSNVTMFLVASSNTGNRTLASRGLASIVCITSNTFIITGGGVS